MPTSPPIYYQLQFRKESVFIMKVTICIGSSCHLKGSRQIVEQLQFLVAENNLKEKVELSGTFCMGNCVNGVNVMIDDKQFSLSPETTKAFFEKEILAKV
ncbi:MAG: NAD(P)H-dependent oxidoreductase subunit E [Oscillospiraceae bacterium]